MVLILVLVEYAFRDKTEDAVAEVLEEPVIKEWTLEEAKAKMIEIYDSNLFTTEQKKEYNELWKTDWKNCIEALVTDYEIRVNAIKSA